MNGPPPGAASPAPLAGADGLPGAEAAIAACGGDARAAVEALLVLVDHLKAELAERDDEIAALATRVSRGYARGRSERAPPR